MTYFVRIRGKAFGPFDEERLKEMKSKGKLGKATEVSENKIDWQPAGDLDFLFPSALPPALPDLAATQAGLEPADWFYSVNGTDGYGPVTRAIVVQMLQAGTLQGESLVWKQGQNARALKTEPAFSGTGGAGSNFPPISDPGPKNRSDETFGGDEPANVRKIFAPLAESLGWMMFLKVIFLISVIFIDLSYLGWAIFMLSRAIGSDSVQRLMLTLLSIVVAIGFCFLATQTVLCFWKYHTDLHQALATGRESDLLKANRSQAAMWKWCGIFWVFIFALTILSILATIVLLGFGTGSIERLFLR